MSQSVFMGVGILAATPRGGKAKSLRPTLLAPTLNAQP